MQPAIWVTRSSLVSSPVASRSNSQMRLPESSGEQQVRDRVHLVRHRRDAQHRVLQRGHARLSNSRTSSAGPAASSGCSRTSRLVVAALAARELAEHAAGLAHQQIAGAHVPLALRRGREPEIAAAGRDQASFKATEPTGSIRATSGRNGSTCPRFISVRLESITAFASERLARHREARSRRETRPRPRPPRSSRRVEGSKTQPATGRPRSASATDTANCGTPSTNSFVPSSGSTIHTRSACEPLGAVRGLLGEQLVAGERGAQPRTDRRVRLEIGGRHRVVVRLLARRAVLRAGVSRHDFAAGLGGLPCHPRLALEAHSSSSRSEPFAPRRPFERRRRRRSLGSHTSQCPQGVGSPSSK